MAESENQVNIQITEATKMGALVTNFNETSSSVPLKNDGLPVENSGESASDSVKKPSDNGDHFRNRKGMPRSSYITVFIYTTIYASMVGLLISSLTVNRLKNSTIWEFKIWRWCLLLVVIMCGGLTTYLLIDALLLIKKLWLHEIKLYYFLGVKKSAVAFIWLGLILLAWVLVFDRGVKLSKDNKKIVDDITRGLGGVVIGAVIWLVKTGLVMHVASFHIKNMIKKIKEANHHCNILRAVLNKSKKKEVDEDRVELVIEVIRNKKLPSLCYTHQDKKEITNEHQDRKEITKEDEAENAANKFFKESAASDDDKYIDLKPLLEFVEDEEVRNHLKSVAEDKQGGVSGDKQKDDSENKKIKRSTFRSWVVSIFREYDSLNNALKYEKTAVDELNMLASVVALAVTLIVWLLMMEVLSTKILVFMTSQFLLVVFIFGNTAKTIFEAIIFVFVMHPFDVGDRCIVDGTQMVVDEMEILTTTFLRYDGARVYYPNSILATKPISNLYRSPKMSESLEFAIDFSTPIDTIHRLREEIQTYFEKNPRHWGDHSVQFKEIENMNKLKVVLIYNHKTNFQDAAKCGKRRSILVLGMKEIFEKLNLKCNLLPQPVHLSYATGAGLHPNQHLHLPLK